MSSKLIAAAIAVAAVLSAVVFVYSPALMLQAGDPMAVQLGFYGAVAATPPASSSQLLSCSGNGGSACASRRWRLEPVPCLGWRREDAVDRGVHACVDALD